MSQNSLAGRCIWGTLHLFAGIAFFFAIIGVFGMTTAIGSLTLFVALGLVSILKPERKKD
jgi:hypothetical protein